MDWRPEDQLLMGNYSSMLSDKTHVQDPSPTLVCCTLQLGLVFVLPILGESCKGQKSYLCQKGLPFPSPRATTSSPGGWMLQRFTKAGEHL